MSQDTVLVWMLSLNREYTKEVGLCGFVNPSPSWLGTMWCWPFFSNKEYDVIYRLQQVAFPNDKQEYKPSNADSFREGVTSILFKAFLFTHAQSLFTRQFDDPTSPLAHDATSSCSSCQMGWSHNAEWETLDWTCVCLSLFFFTPSPTIAMLRVRNNIRRRICLIDPDRPV